MGASAHHDLIEGSGWGGRDRTYECRNQNPMPYHLATPQKLFESVQTTACATFKRLLQLQNLSAGAAASHARRIRAYRTVTAAIPPVLPLPCRTRRTRKRRSRSSGQERISPAMPDVPPLRGTACTLPPANRCSARFGVQPENPAPSEGRALSSKSYFVSIPDA